MSVKITRYDYAGMYGPTKGDKIRLADTELFIEVEKDLTTYGEEVKLEKLAIQTLNQMLI